MIEYNKDSIKENLTIEEIYDIVYELGGDPIFTSFGLISSTICHNRPGEGSKKLYYYENTRLFKCFTGCSETFDIFELIIKAKKIQQNLEYSLNKAMFYVIYKFNISGEIKEETTRADELELIDKWKEDYDSSMFKESVTLPAIDKVILSRFSHPSVRLWELEGISPRVMEENSICYYEPEDQIVIPHFDKDNRLIGLRGRTTDLNAEQFGKYRPLCINKIIYKHPLRYNLYNINNSYKNIGLAKTAIVFESEKSTLMYQSHFGKENDISTAVCGFTISDYQIRLLLEAGAQEIIIAFDRQFEEINDDSHKKLVQVLTRIHNKYKKYVKISFIFDKEKITSYKASPIDEGKEKFLYLLDKRVAL